MAERGRTQDDNAEEWLSSHAYVRINVCWRTQAPRSRSII